METIVSKKQLDKDALESKVKSMYRDVALNPHNEYHFEMGRPLAERLGYPSVILDKIPAESIESFAGVGYYFDLLDLKAGETVLDLGSGSGMDVFFAAQLTGDSGKVIGIDMTEEQLTKSINLANSHSYGKVYFQNAHIELLPIENESVDAVISNGVVNLSADKKSVFEEAARILKPGGRLALADIVTSVELPENISCDATLWAACIGGAAEFKEYINLIESAGLKVVQVKENPYRFISENAQGATDQFGIKSISICAVK
ncbi:MAG: methyltransferase domain-containing protein [Roseivirga sp.]|nr:methyltransferase domain-containing protein [Roseivirga sp.]